MSETFSGAFDGVTRILKGTENPGEAWGKMVALFREVSPDAMWDTLPAPDLEGDIERAVAWLGLHWKPSPRQPVRGVYLGLDTLNQDRGDISKNVEVSMSSAADPEVLSQDYAGGHGQLVWAGPPDRVASGDEAGLRRKRIEFVCGLFCAAAEGACGQDARGAVSLRSG